MVAQQALADPRALRLMTIPGVSSVVSSTVLASIGDISRFPTPEKLSSYFGLTPKIRQSGDRPARHGRISKQGNTAARKMLVEAAWSAKTAAGPLRAFFVRVHKKRGAQAAAVATARKLAVMIWHVLASESEYAFARPAFTAMKLRKVALKAGAPREYGKAGPGGTTGSRRSANGRMTMSSVPNGLTNGWSRRGRRGRRGVTKQK